MYLSKHCRNQRCLAFISRLFLTFTSDVIPYELKSCGDRKEREKWGALQISIFFWKRSFICSSHNIAGKQGYSLWSLIRQKLISKWYGTETGKKTRFLIPYLSFSLSNSQSSSSPSSSSSSSSLPKSLQFTHSEPAKIISEFDTQPWPAVAQIRQGNMSDYSTFANKCRDQLIGRFSNDRATAAKTTLFKSLFSGKLCRDYFDSRKISNVGNFPGIDFLGTAPKFRERRRNLLSCVFTSSIRFRLKEFHVVVVRWRQRNL